MEVNFYTRDTASNKVKAGSILWAGYSHSDSVVSIPDLVDKNITSYRKEYVDLIHSFRTFSYKNKPIEEHLLCHGVSFWWGSLIQEKSVYKTPEIYILYKFMALRDYCLKMNISSINLVTLDKNMLGSFVDFFEKNKIAYSITGKNKRKLPLMRVVKESLPHTLKSFSWLAYYLFKRKKVMLWNHKTRKVVPQITVMSYLPNYDKVKSEKGVFDSNYWGPLMDKIHKDHGSINHLLIFAESPSLNFNGAIKLKNKLNKVNSADNFILLEEMLDLSAIMKSIAAYISMTFRSFRLSTALVTFAKNQHIRIPISTVLKDSWLSSIRGMCCIQSGLYQRLFNRYFSSCEKQTIGLYLMENHGWERFFINAWKKHRHGKIIGYAHSIVREDDVRYFNSPSCVESPMNEAFFPDRVAVNTKKIKKYFLDQGFGSDRVFQVDAIRYLYLSKVSKNPASSCINKVLILTDISEVTARHVLELCNEALSNFNISVVIKPHPLLPHPKKLVQETFHDVKNYSIIDEHLSKILYEVDFVILSAATSSLLEVMAMGLPYAAILNPNMFNLSPLPVEEINFVRSVAELKEQIRGGGNTGYANCDFRLDDKLSSWDCVLKKQNVIG